MTTIIKFPSIESATVRLPNFSCLCVAEWFAAQHFPSSHPFHSLAAVFRRRNIIAILAGDGSQEAIAIIQLV